MAERIASEFREMNAIELNNQVLKVKEELMRLRFQHTTGQLTDTSVISKKKQEVARILTIIKEKENSEA